MDERSDRAMTKPVGKGPVRFADDAGDLCCSGRSELRCGCGSLLARVVGTAVELKCRRCKRTWNIPLQRS
jgi:hypothetical protein